MEKKSYNALDLCKPFLITLVVAIHTGPLKDCRNPFILNLYRMLAEAVVPCFFLISGFLLGIHLKETLADPANGRALRSYGNKILKMYLLATAAYFPLAVWNFIKHQTPPLRAVFIYLRGFLWLGQQYNSWPLWYLLGIVYTMCLMMLLWKKGRSFEDMMACALVVWAANSCFKYFITDGVNLPGAWGSLAAKVSDLSGGTGVLSAMFYFPLGVYLSKRPLQPKIAAAMAVSGACMTLLLGRGSTAMEVGLVSSLTYVRLADRPVYPLLRRLSTAVFLDHMYAYTIFYFLVYGKKTDGPITFLGTMVLSVLGALVWISWKDRVKGRKDGAHGPKV